MVAPISAGWLNAAAEIGAGAGNTAAATHVQAVTFAGRMRDNGK